MSATMFLTPTMLSKPSNIPKTVNPSPQQIHPKSISTNKNQDFNPNPSNSATKTAPWMNTPLVLEPNQVIDFTKPKTRKKSPDNNKEEKTLTQKVSGGRGKHAMKKILYSIDNLEQESQELEDTQKHMEFDLSLGKLGDNKFGDNNNNNNNVGKNKKWFGRKLPWEREERMVFRRMKREKTVTAADLSLDDGLLERLRSEARKMRSWVKVKKAGVNEGVVEQIRAIWNSDELAMVKFDVPLCRNMDRAREIVEIKTGGLVVWSKKDTLVIYRGCDYRNNKHVTGTLYQTVGGHDDKEETMPVQGSLFEREADRLLDGLGPRFIDWWMPKPLPVDADLLPEVVPGYKPPSRLYPLSGRSKLTDTELTHLRKQAYHLPTHFVLGRNRNLQGLAAAILKLWGKCHIAKIAVKWGIPNTSNEQMASELKLLTGGVLLLRNKFYIILYRGKDFLPPDVAELVINREAEIKSFQLQEETMRANTVEMFDYLDQPSSDFSTSSIGTLKEFETIQSEHEGFKAGISEAEMQLEAEKLKLEKEIRIQEHKYLILKMKINKASKELAKLAWEPVEPNADREIITSEERESLRKIGLKMDSTLVLGRRGVFDGVIEGLHQHWKHREIVKVVTMQRVFSRILYTAQCLEAESGGVLVSIEKMKLGYAIIIYRGKNYKRPSKFSRNLLTKREALQKSLEMQRIGSLRFFANMRQQAIYELKCKLDALKNTDNDENKLACS
ncbi:putative RNA-binding, CRM domain, YhbY-like superfamily [Helianthus annuus]|uniref:Putative chloroplast splicing factor n=1 Tax=Helianthus annuus TaxID=4232 RepID=A0A251SGL8_HELAN|nr:chloroplastic group IIA intron splicing facilitator CRS1, chloroplastic [Helianthus annuus]XP_022009624.1 chloroplastic group IIA intron splicing facilitator CRS1, chloroplastic [Helianthus annuus]KAF5768859.1 putative RNA-binding, CRM domain, YhbY-like superfamily [Helianthus annuus]KAJ0468383.1 putative RNA-binding, CRM domain, YhbY-like superfamily [Helianthus annuus]KAJ0853520.1 putative RNA-binding, CRM domain, YhbY-like superfamily [Helianthus annuus]